ncbi:MAG: FAD-dependent monooxygenase [Flavobacteriia bacterium]|nr:FAD-dependent monooxygenase [Flavobacteriia bacterium]OJX35305.1 MAG: kynurenine 3-monooxygenase [Flavobacteriia bacterium 40-80]
MEKIGIVGAGLVGSLQAILMAKKGYEVHVFERREDLRTAPVIEGRSINLALSDRGWKALQLAGIKEEIEKIAIPMYGRCMHALDGTLTYQPYGKEDQAIYSVSRGELNRQLLNLAGAFPNVQLHFHKKCDDLNLETNALIFTDSQTKKQEEHTLSRIFATDGAYSAVRVRMQKSMMFDYSQKYLEHGYKELVINANPDGSHKLEKNYLHIWPRGKFMLIALANLDGSFTCTLFFPMHGEESFETIDTTEKVTAFFRKTFPDALELMPDLAEVYMRNPTSTLMMVRCHPWNYKDQVVLLGDAAHAMVPFYGQGMNCGFEDCTVFYEMLEKAGDSWENIMSDFSGFRQPDGEAIIDLALDNYIEMREKTGDPDFLLQKKIEAKFSKLYPNLWTPLYSQVTFSNTRYSEAYANGKRQDAIMKKILEIENIHECWDEDFVMEELLKLVK